MANLLQLKNNFEIVTSCLDWLDTILMLNIGDTHTHTYIYICVCVFVNDAYIKHVCLYNVVIM